MKTITTDNIVLPNLDSLSDLEKMALINISYSRLDMYDTCPSKYFYTYVQKEERIFGPPAALGNVIHSTLEDHVGEELDYKAMLERMEVHREVFDPDKEINDELISAGKEMLAEFVDRHKDEPFDIIGKELPLQLIVGSALITGYIDLVLRTPQGIHVIDYKTGKYEVAAKNIHENLQLGMYALAMSQQYPDEDIYAELYYLRSTRRKGHWFSKEDLEAVYYRVLDAVNNIIEDQNFKATEQRFPCTFCDFSQNGVCPTGKARLNKKKGKQWSGYS